jgi:hypothetical protein
VGSDTSAISALHRRTSSKLIAIGLLSSAPSSMFLQPSKFVAASGGLRG